jgi:hypothetical protein
MAMTYPGSIAGRRGASLSAWLWPLVLCGLLLLPAGCDGAGARSGLAEGSDAHGTFGRVEGVGVLTLWGEPYQRGQAHGRLLAQGVLDMVDTLCGSNLLLKHTSDYERVILPMMDRFVFDPADEEEMRGILDGVTEKLGDKAVLRRIGRPLTLADLKACNTAGDWYRQGCSSFAAWGSLAQDGHAWVGHNFDFVPAEAFFANQIIIVRKPLGAKKAWATVSAPGFIGCITGINSQGVFATTHDVFPPLRPLTSGYVPRLLVLRRLLETCSARDLQSQAMGILQASPQMFDQAILMAGPVKDGTGPAVVFERGADGTTRGDITVRGAGDNEPAISREEIACTNHFRKGPGPRHDAANYRYWLIQKVLAAKTGRGDKVDFTVARKIMGAARLPITVHTVIADLDTLDFWYAAGEFLSPPGPGDFVKLPVKQWFAGE